MEGLRALDIPAFSVQYHPEAAAGPHDANYLFDRFRDMVIATQALRQAHGPPLRSGQNDAQDSTQEDTNA